MNNTQRLLLTFFGIIFIALIVILLFDPELYDAQLEPLGLAGMAARLGFLGAIALLLIVLAIGTMRRWRLVFWLLVIAMAAGLLRLPAFGLQLVGLLPMDVPAWYAGLQATIGLVQVGIAVLMYAGYRQHGTWGAF